MPEDTEPPDVHADATEMIDMGFLSYNLDFYKHELNQRNTAAMTGAKRCHATRKTHKV